MEFPSEFSGVDSGGAAGARAPPEFGGSEKGTEREIDNPLLQAPLDLKSYLRLWNSFDHIFFISEKCTQYILDRGNLLNNII